MLTPTTNSSRRELGESVIFQPVLQAYPTHHSWIITAHVSLGNLKCHCLIGNFPEHGNYYVPWTNNHQPKLKYYQHYSTLSNIEDIYNSAKITIISAIKLLQLNPSFDGQLQPHTCHRRSLLPFLGDAFSWFTGITTTKDINNMETMIVNCYTFVTTRNPSAYHINTKCH